MNYMVSKSRKGSITIEVAIVFTVVLILITMIITAMNVQKTDMYMQQAIEQSSEDLSILGPFSRLGEIVVEGSLEDEDIGENAKKAYSSLVELSNAFTDLTGLSTEDLILNGMLSQKIKNDIASEFIARTDSRNLYTPDSIEVVLGFDTEHFVIEEIITYSVNTIFGEIYRTNYSVIPFYGVYNSDFSGAATINKPSENINPWELSNFERGKHFSKEYGSNLPSTFPVIDVFENGKATSVVSMDLTKDTYGTEKNIKTKITEKLDAIKNFEGADVVISGQRYTIDKQDIKDKNLVIIIPANTPEDRCKTLTKIIDDYSNQDFNVTIIKSGESY